ncbi:MAG: 3-hydroxyacyl-ACP dehydratase FabZ [Thermoleophilia bacterium]|nr:3-hydroxyacyl-ACP dehydratase FabZ [Thermoleophilia bacterium]MDH3725404.1 3-hydroxyacyl-ACP dehydratase FabZ [Thermoleophilia bacterium]
MSGAPSSDPAELLPHRPPFLFVDEIVDIVPGRKARARWHIDAGADFFAGHFPGRPLLPGVLMVEALAQTAGLAAAASSEHRGKLAVFAGIEKARFRRMVVPGETLDMSMEITRWRGPLAEATGGATVDGERTVEATIRFAVTEQESPA